MQNQAESKGDEMNWEFKKVIKLIFAASLGKRFKQKVFQKPAGKF